jgi:superfamily I DNA and/or RNA helicase
LIQILELFVDEAAATTEAEIIIPLHLRPRRMLAVGDPKQLPASVTSQRAADFGLDKSLLDRLMFGCGKEHMMLDVQYRMSPAISAFPSSIFYNNKLRNGQNVSSPT